MAVKVRLTRVGSRKNPVWRVVVADSRSPRDGRVIETVGRYNAQRNPSEIVLNQERLRHWVLRGAQPTDTVRGLMRASGIGPNGEPGPAPVPAGAAGTATTGEPSIDRPPAGAVVGPDVGPEGGPGEGIVAEASTATGEGQDTEAAAPAEAPAAPDEAPPTPADGTESPATAGAADVAEPERGEAPATADADAVEPERAEASEAERTDVAPPGSDAPDPEAGGEAVRDPAP